MSIIIRQGETKNFIYQMNDKNNVFEATDTLLFAIKNVDKEVVFTDERIVSGLIKDETTYTLTIELSSALTKTFQTGDNVYFFDLTLLKGDKKIPLTDVKTIDVLGTVGASISEG